MINNFPIEPLRSRCDVVVGHYATPLRSVTRKELGGALALSGRTLEVGMHVTSKQRFHECDVMLHCPRLNEYGLSDTNPKHHQQIFEAGREAALAAMDSIRGALDAVGQALRRRRRVETPSRILAVPLWDSCAARLMRDRGLCLM